MKHLSFLLLLAAVLVAACSSGPVRRISEPAASIQQLQVNADGSWNVQLRLQNYSSIGMRFERLRLELVADGQPAGTLEAAPELEIAGESAEVFEVAVTPDPAARMLLADVLASSRSLAYGLNGEIGAAPSDRGKARDYRISRNGRLSPVPGLPGVLR